MYHLIFNPVAGNGRSEKSLHTVENILKQQNVEYKVSTTEQPKHATKIAKQMIAEGADKIVAIGGDGTIAEVAKAVYGTNAALGMIPAGTGNDYRRAVGVPNEIEKSVEFILKGKPTPCDALDCNGEIYLNIISMGFDVEVAKRAQKYKFFGSASYTLAAIDRAFSAKGTKAKITIDEKVIEKEILLAAIGNGTHYGGGINSLPDADIQDGLLDICIADPTSPLNILKLLPKYSAGKHLDLDIIHIYKAKEIKIELDGQAMPINADGEILPPSKILHVKVLKGLINILR